MKYRRRASVLNADRLGALMKFGAPFLFAWAADRDDNFKEEQRLWRSKLTLKSPRAVK